ncbi:MAG: hypothetical protein IPN36_16725 [Bacteroidetes bacterium]|nr:hypothetical protein [Bacteroidota bacterium]
MNLAAYESQLRAAIGSDLTTLSLTIEGLSTLKQNNFILKQGITISELNTFPIEKIKQREINKCFKSILTSLQDYFDGLISVLLLKDEVIPLPIPATPKYLNSLLPRKLKNY